MERANPSGTAILTFLPKNGACKLVAMLTLDDLCAQMAASDRPLTERAARDWWTKGLLPRPRRRGMGQGRGTETFWTDPRVAAQAEAAYDFLALHARTYSVAVHLWLSGYPVELPLVRASYERMIGRHFRSMQRHAGDDLGNRIGSLAAQLSRQMVKTNRLSNAARDDLTDLVLPFLETFFSVNWTFEEEGLSELWASVEPYLWDTKVSGALELNDGQLATAASYLRRMGSLAAQRDAIRSASDYELIRARRLVLFVIGYARRLIELSGCDDALDMLCRNFVITLSRPAVPILVMVMREDWLRARIIGFLLNAATRFRRGVQSGDFARTLAQHEGGQRLVGPK